MTPPLIVETNIENIEMSYVSDIAYLKLPVISV